MNSPIAGKRQCLGWPTLGAARQAVQRVAQGEETNWLLTPAPYSLELPRPCGHPETERQPVPERWQATAPQQPVVPNRRCSARALNGRIVSARQGIKRTAMPDARYRMSGHIEVRIATAPVRERLWSDAALAEGGGSLQAGKARTLANPLLSRRRSPVRLCGQHGRRRSRHRHSFHHAYSADHPYMNKRATEMRMI